MCHKIATYNHSIHKFYEWNTMVNARDEDQMYIAVEPLDSRSTVT